MMVQILTPDEWRLFRKLRLAALAEAPSAFQTALADWQGDGDTEERWRARLTNVPFNAVAYFEGIPAGMVSGTVPEGGESELISFWVAPHARGRGVGIALIDAVATWARAAGAGRIALDVREDNHHARSLYERCGFVDRGRITGDARKPIERRMSLAL